MDISDIFGDFPARPHHPDFWRLSSIILKLDGRMTRAASHEEKDAIWTENLSRWVDEDSANYTAMQRAMRPLGVTTVGEARKNAQMLVLFTVLWMEGFQIGAEFAAERSLGDEIDELDETGLRLLLSTYGRHVETCSEQGTKPLSVKEWFDALRGSALSEEEGG